MKTSEPDLKARIEATGYFPDLVWDVVDRALAGESVVAHLVRREPTMTSGAVGSHVTVLVLTPSRLLVAHVDDRVEDQDAGPTAAASVDAVALGSIITVGATHVITPDKPGNRSVGLSICWGGRARFDVEPARCPDPACEADHGYVGNLDHDDVVIRVSEVGDGPEGIDDALAFLQAVSRATAGR